MEFGKSQYWEKRFEDLLQGGKEIEEWCTDVSSVESELRSLIDGRASLLHIGCGLSDLQFDLANKSLGALHVGMDYVWSVLPQNKRKEERMPKSTRAMFEWLRADARKLPFRDQLFDLVIDKGLIDQFYILEDEGLETGMMELLREVDRVLSSDGRYAFVSIGNKYDRLYSLQKSGLWDKDVRAVLLRNETPTQGPAYLYVVRKDQQRVSRKATV